MSTRLVVFDKANLPGAYWKLSLAIVPCDFSPLSTF